MLPLIRPVNTMNGVLPGRLFFDVTIYFISGLNALLLLDYDVLETERGATTASRGNHLVRVSSNLTKVILVFFCVSIEI